MFGFVLHYIVSVLKHQKKNHILYYIHVPRVTHFFSSLYTNKADFRAYV